MNKALLTLNIVLVAAVGFLFYQVYSKSGNVAGSATDKINNSAYSTQTFKVGFFDMDSIETNFSLFKEMEKEVGKKEDSMNAIINQMRANFQQEYQKFQEQQSKMTPDQVNEAGKQFSQMDMDIKNRTTTLNQNYQTYYMNKQQEIVTLIKKYCIEFNKTNNYSLIIANEPGLVYYKDTAFNITTELLRGLNEKYGVKKKN